MSHEVASTVFLTVFDMYFCMFLSSKRWNVSRVNVISSETEPDSVRMLYRGTLIIKFRFVFKSSSSLNEPRRDFQQCGILTSVDSDEPV